MDQTTLLNLPYIMAAQAQKHVTHNEALRILDALIHLRVEDRGREIPPDEPAEGQRHAVGAEPEGAFAGQAGKIAAFQDGAWTFHEPQQGWLMWDAADGALLVFDGADWTSVFDLLNVSLIGVNAAADDTNRLAVAADATLLSHDGAGHQLKVNKAAAGDTGSLLFQTGWSGRAEMGLAGSDDFSIKVSSDGATWRTAMTATAATGRLGIGTGAPVTALHIDGQTAIGNAVNSTRVTSGTPSSAGRVFSLIDTAGVVRVWRRENTNAAVIELVIGANSDNAADSNIRRWNIGVAYGTDRFAIDRVNGGALTALAIESNGRVGIGTAPAHSSAQLDVASTVRGFLPPRMTSTQRDAISSPAEGLIVYNTTDQEPQFWDGSAWLGNRQIKATAHTVATLPSASAAGAGSIIYVTDEAGGAVPAFSDGTDWRRLTDRVVVS